MRIGRTHGRMERFLVAVEVFLTLALETKLEK